MPTRARTLALLAVVAILGASAAGVSAAGARAPEGGTQALDLTVRVGLVPGSSATLRYHGTFTGAPFGRGTADVNATMGGAGSAHVTFAISTRRGTVSGSADVRLAFGASLVTTSGTASITRGTGAYRRVRGRGLRIVGSSPVAEVHTTMRLTGRITV